MKQIKCRIIGYELGVSGNRQDGTPYQVYKYKFFDIEANKERTMSGFIDPEPFLRKPLLVEYDQDINPKGGYFNNVKFIAEDLTDAVEAANKQYNVVGVGAPTTHSTSNAPDWDAINKKKEDSIMFGMVFNKAMDWLISERNLEQTPTVTFDTHFDKIFNHIYDAALKKRKEKIGY